MGCAPAMDTAAAASCLLQMAGHDQYGRGLHRHPQGSTSGAAALSNTVQLLLLPVGLVLCWHVVPQLSSFCKTSTAG